jgi:hypothetical protein
MIISSKGEITDAIEVPDGTAIFEYFRVKVMVGSVDDPECVGAEDFKEFPDDAQVMWSVLKHKGSYAEVTKIMVPEALPFSDADSCSNCQGDCNCCDTARELDAIEMAAYDAAFETEDDLPF